MQCQLLKNSFGSTRAKSQGQGLRPKPVQLLATLIKNAIVAHMTYWGKVSIVFGKGSPASQTCWRPLKEL